jgi:hypothetical protein
MNAFSLADGNRIAVLIDYDDRLSHRASVRVIAIATWC